MSKAKLDRLREQIHSPTEDLLFIDGSDDLSDREFRSFCKELKKSRVPRTLQIARRDFTESWASTIADTLPDSSIRALEITQTKEVEPRAVDILLDAIPNAPQLRKLELRSTQMKPRHFIALGDMLPETRLEHINLNGCGMEQDGLAALSRGVAKSKTIRQLDTIYNPATNEIGEGYGVMLEALTQNRSLFSWNFRNSPAAYDDSISNPELEAEFADAERKLLYAGPPNLRSFATHTQTSYGADLAKANRERHGQLLMLGEDSDLAQLSLAERFELYERKPGIKKMMADAAEDAGHSFAGSVNSYFAGFPELDAHTPITEEALIRSGTERSPIDHPKTWIDHPDLLAQLLASSDDPQSLLTRRLLGGTLIDYAMQMGDLEINLETLNQHGIRLQGDNLLGTDGELSDFGRHVANGRGFERLFVAENWKGASKQDLADVVKALPDEAAQRIGNLHALQVSVDRTQEGARLR